MFGGAIIDQKDLAVFYYAYLLICSLDENCDNMKKSFNYHRTTLPKISFK